MTPKFPKALQAIDDAHSKDPKKITVGGQESPYELHYAQKMTSYLEKRAPNASEVLRLAVRGQHFRRWEVPRDSYPMTRIGYHAWRTHLKKRQADQVGAILDEAGYSIDESKRCMVMIKKEGLKSGDEDVQILEDVACLVFLDDQFEEFQTKHDEDKIVKLLAKTWVKMSKAGQDMALEMHMSDRCQELVEKALKS